ncbi:MAG TPA: hypothetical protein VIL46_01935 [Gemmataceae bacterium]
MTRGRTGGPLPATYWPQPWLTQLWFDLGVRSYFHTGQNSGNLFNRANAAETHRRPALVRPFELQRFERCSALYDARMRQVHREMFGARPGAAPPVPTRGDLLRLRRDPAVDWVVVPQHFPDLAAATNGRWSVYDARRIRNSRESLAGRGEQAGP